MANSAITKDTTGAFRKSAQPSIPEYVFVYKHKSDHVEVRFENVTINAQDGTSLIKDINFTLNGGESAGLTGPNGGGKSSIFRHIGELTDGGHGRIHITLPEGKRMMSVSQEMRKPQTTLHGMMSYPNDPSTYTHEQYEACLTEAGLPQLQVQLPWNAAKPDILFPIFKSALDNELWKHTRNISPEAAEKIQGALIKALNAKIAVPENIAEYFTPEYEDTLREKIISYVKESFDEITPNRDKKNDRAMQGLFKEMQEAGIIEKDTGESESPEKVKTILFPARLGRQIARNTLSNGANKVQNWLFLGHKMPLSGGQAEQLGFARLFLQVDEVGLFLLDEATSALKEDKADELYNKLFSKMAKGTSAIGIIHHNALLKHFTHHLELDGNKQVTLKALKSDASGSSPQTPEI